MDARIGKALDAAGWSGRVIAHRFDEPAAVVWVVLESGHHLMLPLPLASTAELESEPEPELPADPPKTKTKRSLKSK